MIIRMLTPCVRYSVRVGCRSSARGYEQRGPSDFCHRSRSLSISATRRSRAARVVGGDGTVCTWFRIRSKMRKRSTAALNTEIVYSDSVSQSG